MIIIKTITAIKKGIFMGFHRAKKQKYFTTLFTNYNSVVFLSFLLHQKIKNLTAVEKKTQTTIICEIE